MNQYRPRSTLEQWRILQAVVDYGGYAKAGEALNKSQSSLNHAVSKLQELLGVQLLHVVGRKAVLTPEGEVLLRRSRQLTQNIQDLEFLAENITCGWEPEIRLAVEMPYPNQIILNALEAFYPQSRGTRVQIKRTVISATADAVTSQWATIAIATADLVPKGMPGEPLCCTTFIAVCHHTHPLANGHTYTSNELAEYLQIVIRDGGTNPIDKGWLRSEQRWTVDSFHDAIEVLKQGLGFCWLPYQEVYADLQAGTLKHITLNKGSTRRINFLLVHPNQEYVGPSTKLFTQCLLDEQDKFDGEHLKILSLRDNSTSSSSEQDTN